MIGFPTFNIDAIIASNGLWQALTGASIVISGLAVLAFVIAQLHKIIAFFESPSGLFSDFFIPSSSLSIPIEPKEVLPEKKVIPFEIYPDTIIHHKKEIKDRFIPLTESYGEYFNLQDLYRAFYENEIPHPHLTIKAFREAKILTTQNNLQFSWNI